MTKNMTEDMRNAVTTWEQFERKLKLLTPYERNVLDELFGTHMTECPCCKTRFMFLTNVIQTPEGEFVDTETGIVLKKNE